MTANSSLPTLRADSSTISYTEEWANFAVPLTYVDIPTEVVEHVKLSILDTIGGGVGAVGMEMPTKINEIVTELGPGSDARIIGDGRRVNAAAASLANGVLCRVLDMDDTHFRSWDHASCYLIPTALAVGEKVGASGKDLITACVVGYEFAGRFGRVLHRGEAFLHQYEPFLHDPSPQLTQRQFGAAAAASKIQNLSADQMVSALGFVAPLANTLLQTHLEKADGLPWDSGWNGYVGVVATMMAKGGLKGPKLILEGTGGAFYRLAPEAAARDLPRLVEGLGQAWESHLSTFKMYPSGHGTHYFINSVRRLRERGLNGEDIEKIVCRVPPMRYKYHFSPPEKAYKPSVYDARFSLPFLLATTLRTGTVVPLSFTEDKVNDPVTLELASKVVPDVDDKWWEPSIRGHVIVTLKDGTVLEEKTPHDMLPGTPENMVPIDALLEKFHGNVATTLDGEQAQALADALLNLESMDNVSQLLDLTLPSK